MTDATVHASSPTAAASQFHRRMDRLRQRAEKVASLDKILKRRRFSAVRNAFYDSMWHSAAKSVGATFTKVNEFSQISRGGLSTFVFHSDIMLDDAVTGRLMLDKALTYSMMAAKGLTVPDHCVFSLRDMGPAIELLSRYPGGIAVKPATGLGAGGGQGVTTGIASPDQLRRAARFATSINPRLLAEPMLTGTCYRLLYLDGEFLDALRRDPPTVVGDGRSTIRRLIAHETKARLTERPFRAMSPLLTDQDCHNYLNSMGLALDHRPPAGVRVTVKRTVNENAAPDNHSEPTLVHPDIIRAGGQLVRDLNVRLAGLDLIAGDISAPLHEGQVMFHEVNTGPGLHHHYLTAQPERAVPVAEHVLTYMFDQKIGVMQL